MRRLFIKNMKLRIITTGGTIDKIYFDAKSEFQVGDPQIDVLLSEANVCLIIHAPEHKTVAWLVNYP